VELLTVTIRAGAAGIMRVPSDTLTIKSSFVMVFDDEIVTISAKASGQILDCPNYVV
jgi:hypothetical protein